MATVGEGSSEARVSRYLTAGRQVLDRPDRPLWVRRYFSPAAAGLYSQLLPRLRKHATGRVLDAGCGTMPFRSLIESLESVTAYHGLDAERRSDDLTFLTNIANMSVVPSDSYDTILCTEVLEHVEAPEAAVRELYRVLRVGGMLLLTVPFLARLHEEPHDYSRLTEHGLRAMLIKAGFTVHEIVPTGSVFSFLGHQISSLLVAGTQRIPVIRALAFGINALIVVLPCYLLDRPIALRRKLPLGYMVVAEKK